MRSVIALVTLCLFTMTPMAPGALPPADEPAKDATKNDAVEKAPTPAENQREQRRRAGRERQGQASGPAVGSTLPAGLHVHNTNGSKVTLASLTSGQPTVIVGGCLTCPKYLRAYPDVEAIAKDYGPKGVQFFYLYKTLAHPENHGLIQPYTIEERLAQVDMARKRLGTQVPWLTDTMENEIWAALGNRPNPHLVLDGEGKVITYAQWAEGPALRQALVEAIGPVDSPTTSQSLNLPQIEYVTTPASGVVEPIRRTDILTPIVARPNLESVKETPFYVKLRAEASSELVQGGSGELYIGFRLDPVHEVHWNNLVEPVAWEVTLPEGTTMSPAKANAPKVEAATDIDPREFMVNVTDWSPGTSIPITVKYFACSEKEGWCKPVTQTYDLVLQRDRSAGSVHGRSFRRGGGQEAGRGGRGGRGGRAGRQGGQMSNLAQMDRNGDGKISKDEAPQRMQQRFDRFDTNGDGFIDSDEMEALRNRMQRGRGGRPMPREL